jgi:hypothetical protein
MNSLELMVLKDNKINQEILTLINIKITKILQHPRNNNNNKKEKYLVHVKNKNKFKTMMKPLLTPKE